MDAAFSNKKQAACFVALLAVIMSLPLILGKAALPRRSEIYNSIPWRFGGHPYFQKVIFEEKQPLDIAFIGSSRIWCDIDPVYVSQRLSKEIGRPSEVRTLGWNTAGFDALYFIAEDLLANRKVKLLVVNDEFNPEIGGTKPHRLASRWYRHSDNSDSIAGLPLKDREAYYASAVLGAPRNLLGMARSNQTERSAPENEFSPLKLYKTPDPSVLFGALRVEENYQDPNRAFLHFRPTGAATPEDSLIWSDQTKGAFGTSGNQLPVLQQHFARKLVELARRNQSTVLFLHLPSIEEVGRGKILDAEVWPDSLGSDVRFAGLPPAAFYREMTEDQIRLLFSDPKHLNRNGQEYFTPLITPAILRIFNESTRP